jgi:hypothetical protein
MSELSKLPELVTTLLQEKRHPIELHGPSVHKHEWSAPVEYFPARNGVMIRGMSWYHGLSIDLSLAKVQIVADYNCSETNVYSGWFAAIDRAVREQVFGDALFYLELRHEYMGENTVELKFAFNKELIGIVGKGNFSLGLRDLFPVDSVEQAQVLAARDYQSLCQKRSRQIVVSQSEVDEARSKLEMLIA